MSHNIDWGCTVAVGESGRVVVEIDPEIKKLLHQSLKEDGTNLKDWFLAQTADYLNSKTQQKALFDKRGRPIRRVS